MAIGAKITLNLFRNTLTRQIREKQYHQKNSKENFFLLKTLFLAKSFEQINSF